MCENKSEESCINGFSFDLNKGSYQLNIQSWMKQKCNRDVVCAVSLPIILSRLITSLQIANKRSDETR